MNTFKGQDNAEIKELCSKNQCELVIVPHKLTHKFQPYDITIKQKSHKFNTWNGDRVGNQLKRGVAQDYVKVKLKMSDLKTLHALWIVEMYDYLKQQKGAILNVVDKAGITELSSQQIKYSRALKSPLQKNARCKLFSVQLFS